MNNTVFDAIVVGAGYAGLSASYYLKQKELKHIVFERGSIGESWLSQRWDSFKMNSANKLNVLPGINGQNDPDAFCAASECVSSFKEYVKTFHLPVLENTRVISIEKPSEYFDVTVSTNDTVKRYLSRQVIIASGIANEIKIPSFSKNISSDIIQLHSSEYRNPGQLPAGGILVVGSAQSGCQIAEDLVDAGRKVFLSTSMVARIPRCYRGRDIMDWLIDMKFFEIPVEEIQDPKMLQMKPPQLTGIGDGKRTISLQSLAKKGIIILGKTDSADDENIFFQPNAAMHVKFSDEFSKKVKEMIEGFISKNQLIVPEPQIDEDDRIDENASCASPVTSLNLNKDGIKSIIWATGFQPDFSYIKLPVFKNDGTIKHKDGVSVIPGLYFTGLSWLHSRRSTLLFGIKEDTRFVIEKACDHALQTS